MIWIAVGTAVISATAATYVGVTVGSGSMAAVGAAFSVALLAVDRILAATLAYESNRLEMLLSMRADSEKFRQGLKLVIRALTDSPSEP